MSSLSKHACPLIVLSVNQVCIKSFGRRHVGGRRAGGWKVPLSWRPVTAIEGFGKQQDCFNKTFLYLAVCLSWPSAVPRCCLQAAVKCELLGVHQLLTQAQTTSALYIDERKNLSAPRPPVVQLSTGWRIPFGISIKKCKPLNCSRLLTLDGSKVAAKQDSPVPPFQRI